VPHGGAHTGLRRRPVCRHSLRTCLHCGHPSSTVIATTPGELACIGALRFWLHHHYTTAGPAPQSELCAVWTSATPTYGRPFRRRGGFAGSSISSIPPRRVRRKRGLTPLGTAMQMRSPSKSPLETGGSRGLFLFPPFQQESHAPHQPN